MASDNVSGNTHPHRALKLLLLLALGLRLAWVLTRPVDDASIDVLPDQREYLSLARSLLHGSGFQFLDKRFQDTVHAFRMPGYPLFLAACGGSVRAARLVQALVDTSTVLAVYLLAASIGRKRGGTAFALAGAAIVAFNPYLVYFTGLLLSETLFISMLVWAMVLLMWGNGGRGGRRSNLLWLTGGALLALSVLVRPSAIALPVLLGILSVFANRAVPSAYQEAPSSGGGPVSKSVRWRVPVGTTMVLLVLLSLLPWAVRNRSLLGRWVWLDTNSGFTLYDAYNPDATGGSDQSFIDREPELQILGEVDRSDYLAQKALQFVRLHPGRVGGLIGARLLRTWSPMPLSSEYGRPGLRLIALAYSVPFDILVLSGLFWGNLPRSAKVFLLAPAIYFSVVHALTVGSLRYRVPAEPPMAVIAAGVLGAWGGAAKPWRRAQSV